MARYRGQKSLYEVMSRARTKTSRSSTEPLHPEGSGKAEPEIRHETPKAAKPDLARYRRPKPIQINGGRIELTVPVKVAALCVLAVIACLLLAFRLGQLYAATDEPLIDNMNTKNPAPAGEMLPTHEEADPAPMPEVEDSGESLSPQVRDNQATTSGALVQGNAIVIQEFDKLADLKAVGRYFNQNGIPTEIVQKGQSFFLITRERFDIGELGTKGYQRRKEIKDLGKKYKAPQGLETFSTRYFSDAYSRLIDDMYTKVKE